MISPKTKLTKAEFWQLADRASDVTYELIKGEAIPKMSPKYFHSRVTLHLSRILEDSLVDILLCLKARGFLLLVLRSPLAMSDYSSIVEAIFSPVFRPLQARSLVPLGTVYTKFEVC
jgi:hypothetical protein